jgi:hypothetical protein
MDRRLATNERGEMNQGARLLDVLTSFLYKTEFVGIVAVVTDVIFFAVVGEV